MDESTKAAFDDLKAQAASAESGFRNFADVDGELGSQEQEAAPEDAETAMADGAEGEDEARPDYKALLDRLKRAEKARDDQAGKNGGLMQKIQELEQQIQSRQQQQSPQQWKPLKANESEVEAFAAAYDENWESNSQDEYMRKMYQVAYDMNLNVAQGFISEIQALQSRLDGMEFGSRLAEIGLDRGTFDGIVAEFPSLQKMPLSEQLEVVSRMGRSFGSGGLPSHAQGAPTVQRHRIESPMGGGSAVDPRAKSLRDLEKAWESGDKAKIEKAVSPMWQAWKQQQGL